MKPHRPRKRFGQHFLHDGNVIDRIVAAIAPVRDDVIIEIGPGEGVLTAPLLESGARVIAVELDRDLASTLPRRLGAPDNLEVIQADILRVEPAALASGPVRVVGNLPYNISTPVLFHLFAGSADIVDMHFMLQKEVVERLVASPGSRQYGRLSVMAAFHCEMQGLFTVSPGAFRPPPRVDSAVVRMRPRAQDAADLAVLPRLETIVRHAFGQRRKTLRNALRGVLDEAAIHGAGVDPQARAEVLSLAQFMCLARQPGPDGA